MRHIDYVGAALASLTRGTVYEVHAIVRVFGLTKKQISGAAWKGVQLGVFGCAGRNGPNPSAYWVNDPAAWPVLADLMEGVPEDDVDEPLPHPQIGPQQAWPSVFSYGSGDFVTLNDNAVQAA